MMRYITRIRSRPVEGLPLHLVLPHRWDIVGNNTPVFFFRDPLRFSDLNHAIKRDPRTGLRSAQNNWDFWTLLPEALHQVTIVMSDRGIPKSFRHMHGFGSHTFSMFNAENKRVWVKFHFRSQQGIENLTDEAAAAVVAYDRESNGRDLLEAIECGDFPRWTLFVQDRGTGKDPPAQSF
jgi:catalase